VAYGGQGQLAILEGDPRAVRTSPFTAGSPIAASAYHPSGQYLVLGTADGRVLLWTPGAAEAVAFAEHKGEIVDLAIAPDGRRLVTLGEDRRVLAWEIRDGSLGPPRVLDTEGWRTLAFDGEGSLLAMGRGDGSIRVIRTASGEDAALLQDDPPIFSTRLAFHPEVPLLASGNGYGQVRFWDSRTFADRPPQLSGHRGEINGIAFDVQGDRLLTSGRDAEVRLWTLDDGTLIAPLGGHPGVIRTLAFSRARSEAVSGGLDGLVILRSLAAERWVEDGCGLYGRDFAPGEIKAHGLEQGRSPLCRSPILCPAPAPAPASPLSGSTAD
jgi:WD40 repeat protein